MKWFNAHAKSVEYPQPPLTYDEITRPFAVWWAQTWRSAVLAAVFVFVAHFGGALIGLGLEERTWLSQWTIYPASLFALRWIIQQEIIKYFPGKGYLTAKRMV